MFDELTIEDIQKMQEEMDYRITVIRKDLHEKIMLAKEFGDLSENAEYHEARRAKGRNESRIEYLRAMIKTAKIIEPNTNKDVVGLLSKVTVLFEDDNTEEEYEIATKASLDAGSGKISKESPLGSALYGKKVGDRVLVKVNDTVSYYVVIKSIN
ncbi:MAG: transcription elongation factor GreA [Clostridia bacterium]|nr:transcription elongation factor GreA [Clostridia bacterium]